jgi:uncharacterized protein YegL
MHANYLIRSALVALLLAGASAPRAQNLVVNGSFDDSLSPIPSRGCNTKMVAGYPLTQGWYQVGGSADFYNSHLSKGPRKTSVHKARSGQGRIALVLGEDPAHSRWVREYREFVQTRLSQPLKAGALYSVNFYIVRDKRSVFYAAEAGAFFSGTPVAAGSGYRIGGAEAQVKTRSEPVLSASDRWQLVHGFYRANGGEQYLTLGNFADPVPSLVDGRSIPSKLFRNDYGWYAYYYIDDVVVYEVADSLSDNRKNLPRSMEDEPYNNLVFALDVSGSMHKEDRLSSLKTAMRDFLASISPNEIISVVTFDASPKILLRHRLAGEAESILKAIDSLKTGGGTNVNAAIWKAYELIDSSYIAGGNNRVILVTDAGYQVSGHSKELIEKYARERDVAFSTLLLDKKEFRTVNRLCKKNRGNCVNVAAGNYASAFAGQARQRKIKWYGPGVNRRYTRFTTRLILFSIVAGIVWWKGIR